MPLFQQKVGPIPVPDLENWNTDRGPDVPVMVRGNMYKSGSSWVYYDGRVEKRFNLSGQDLETDPLYLGYVGVDGEWFIKKIAIAATSTTYVSGTSGYAAQWALRTTQTYNYFNSVF